jgi:hypothetical protein
MNITLLPAKLFADVKYLVKEEFLFLNGYMLKLNKWRMLIIFDNMSIICYIM